MLKGVCCFVMVAIIAVVATLFSGTSDFNVETVVDATKKAKEQAAGAAEAISESTVKAAQRAHESLSKELSKTAAMAQSYTGMYERLYEQLKSFPASLNETLATFNFTEKLTSMSKHVDAISSFVETAKGVSTVAVKITTEVASKAVDTMRRVGAMGLGAGKAGFEYMCRDVPVTSSVLHAYDPRLDCLLYHTMQLLLFALKLLGFAATAYTLLTWPYYMIRNVAGAGLVLYVIWKLGFLGWFQCLLAFYFKSPVEFVACSVALRLTLPFYAYGSMSRAACWLLVAYIAFRAISWANLCLLVVLGLGLIFLYFADSMASVRVALKQLFLAFQVFSRSQLERLFGKTWKGCLEQWQESMGVMISSAVGQVVSACLGRWSGAGGPSEESSTASGYTGNTGALLKLTEQVAKLEKSVKEVLAKNVIVHASSKKAQDGMPASVSSPANKSYTFGSSGSAY